MKLQQTLLRWIQNLVGHYHPRVHTLLRIRKFSNKARELANIVTILLLLCSAEGRSCWFSHYDRLVLSVLNGLRLSSAS